MAPVPTVRKKKTRQAGPLTVSTDNVVDNYGRTLTTLQRKQRRIDEEQTENTTVARQHAKLGEPSKQGTSKIIFRDIIPYRKYVLLFNDTSWLNSGTSLQVGWTRPNEYHDLISPPQQEPLPDNKFEFSLDEEGVDYTGMESLEIRLYGAPEGVTAYLDDDTESKSLLEQLTDLIENIIGGDDGLEARIAALEEAVGIPYTGTDTLDERVTDLEGQ